MTKQSRLILSLCLFCLTFTASAEVRYVIDNLIITMRSGQSTQHQVLRTWPSSTKLEVLESGEKYSHVRGPDGTEGWVLNQYITSEPTAKLLLATANQQLAKLKAENKRLKTELRSVQNKEGALSKQQLQLTRESKKQMDELTHLRRVAAKPLKLENENQRLKKELLRLESEHDLLQQENQMLGDSSDQEWFLNGAIVIILGIVIGLIAPSLRMRKKSSWGSL